MAKRTYSFGDEPPRTKRTYSFDSAPPPAVPAEPAIPPPAANGPWGNVILWPCPGLKYGSTLRAALYTRRLFQTTWRDGAAAKKAFAPWRNQWLAAERASHAFAACPLQNAPQAFRALPFAPTTVHSELHTQSKAMPLQDLRLAHLDAKTVSTYGNLALAYIAHAWAGVGGASIMLRMDEQTIAFYGQAAPTCQLFYYAKAVLAPGAVVLELKQGYQFWIPSGAGIKGWPEEKWKGEVDAVDPTQHLTRAFVDGFFQGLASQYGGQPQPRPPTYRIASDDAAKNFGIVPECGDSVDLLIIAAARPHKGDLLVSHPILENGHPLFPGVDGEMVAMRHSLENFMHRAVLAAKARIESAFA